MRQADRGEIAGMLGFGVDADRLFPADPSTRSIARDLYQLVKDLPIISPHGHTDPKWFADNVPFADPASLLLTPDHYVFRMLYSQGVRLEEFGVARIDGGSTERDSRKIWRLFAKHYYLFRGTPSRMWFDWVLSSVFDAPIPLTPENADATYDRISERLQKPDFRPRALFERFNIEALATTESPLDDLIHHVTIRKSGWSGRVITAYRPDNVVDPDSVGFLDNLRRFSELTGDRVGVVAFAGDTMEFPMTTDYAAVETFLRDLGPYDMPVGGTAIGRALVASKRVLERARSQASAADAGKPEERAAQLVILLTDGEDHEGEPVKAAEELASAGIRVFVVGIGSKTGEPIPSYAPDGTWTGYVRDEKGNPVLSALTDQNEAQLRSIAQTGKGKYFRAREGSVGVDEIRALMHGMKQAENKARKVSIAEDRYTWVLLIAFLLLLLEGLLPEAFYAKRRERGASAAAARGLLGEELGP